MVSDRLRMLPLFALAAVLGVSAASPSVRAATGDELLSFKSSLGSTPDAPAQGSWYHEGRSLLPSCPNSIGTPACVWQGARDLNYDSLPDNNCLPGTGCHKQGPVWEHYNAPQPDALADVRSYTEWICFDAYSQSRPLTIPDSSITDSPPWGASTFLNAPAYPVLRVSTGDGNNVEATLPVLNHRNEGKTKIRKTYVPGSATALTLLIKAAAGPRIGGRHFVELRGFGRVIGFGVDGTVGSPTYGRFTLIDGANKIDDSHYLVSGTLFSRTVTVAQPGVPGPHAGEFFTLRVVFRNDGTFDAWLNEDGDQHATGSVTTSTASPPNEVQLTPLVGDDTMWFDFVQLFEGELPVTCPDPVIDYDGDGRVDETDFMNFTQCSNGPGVPASSTFACQCMDSDGDTDLDMIDFGLFQRCLSGTEPVDPTCDD